MLRFVFVLSAAFYLCFGGLLYFLPSAGVGGLTVTPLWVARVAGAVVAAWGVSLALSSSRPSVPALGGLVVANLLVAATLVPAALSGLTALASIPAVLPLGVGAALVLLAVLALLSPRGRGRL